MATGKLTQSEANVQRLLCDRDAMRKLVEDRLQELVEEEFEKHMGHKPYERGKGRSTHRNDFVGYGRHKGQFQHFIPAQLQLNVKQDAFLAGNSPVTYIVPVLSCELLEFL